MCILHKYTGDKGRNTEKFLKDEMNICDVEEKEVKTPRVSIMSAVKSYKLPSHLHHCPAPQPTDVSSSAASE